MQRSPRAHSNQLFKVSYAVGGDGENEIKLCVLDPERGVCADPVGGDATLGVGGPGPPVGAGERQLSPDRGDEKT
jgi:hypothetical protein